MALVQTHDAMVLASAPGASVKTSMAIRSLRPSLAIDRDAYIIYNCEIVHYTGACT